MDETISPAEFAASEAVWLDLSREMADEMRAERECVDAWYEDFKRAVGTRGRTHEHGREYHTGRFDALVAWREASRLCAAE